MFEESLVIFRTHEHKGGIAWGAGCLGWMHLSHGALARSAELFADSLVYYGEVDDKRNSAFGLERLASLAAAELPD